jgi:ubiquitin C-terminal hydrolase
MSIWRTPPLVMIHLKRFQFTQQMKRKLRDLVVFPIEGLDLSRIVAQSSSPKTDGDFHSKVIENQEGKTDTDVVDDSISGALQPLSRNNCSRVESIYDLYGVVHHQGALSGGHYVASLKSEFDGKWRLFNDAHIYELSSSDVVDPSAYILFYVRRDVKGATLEDFWDAREHKGGGLTEGEASKLMKSQERCVIC